MTRLFPEPKDTVPVLVPFDYQALRDVVERHLPLAVPADVQYHSRNSTVTPSLRYQLYQCVFRLQNSTAFRGGSAHLGYPWRLTGFLLTDGNSLRVVQEYLSPIDTSQCPWPQAVADGAVPESASAKDPRFVICTTAAEARAAKADSGTTNELAAIRHRERMLHLVPHDATVGDGSGGATCETHARHHATAWRAAAREAASSGGTGPEHHKRQAECLAMADAWTTSGNVLAKGREANKRRKGELGQEFPADDVHSDCPTAAAWDLPAIRVQIKAWVKKRDDAKLAGHAEAEGKAEAEIARWRSQESYEKQLVAALNRDRDRDRDRAAGEAPTRPPRARAEQAGSAAGGPGGDEQSNSTGNLKSAPFPYIDSLDDARLRELRKKTVVGCDPNKHRLLVGVSLKPGKDIGSVQTVKGQPKFAAGDVDVWRYTNGQRRFDANMPLLQRQREALRVNAVSTHGVDAVALEATLAGFNSRSVNPERYLAYLTALHSVRWATRALYTDMVWRKLRFDALRGRQRAGQRMVAKFKAKHGDPEQAVLVVGDWGARASGSTSARRLHMKHHTPSMGVGTLRLFRRAGYQVGGLLVCLCVLVCAML